MKKKKHTRQHYITINQIKKKKNENVTHSFDQ